MIVEGSYPEKILNQAKREDLIKIILTLQEALKALETKTLDDHVREIIRQEIEWS